MLVFCQLCDLIFASYDFASYVIPSSSEVGDLVVGLAGRREGGGRS